MEADANSKGEPVTLMLFKHGEFMRITAWIGLVFLGGMEALCVLTLIFACFSEPDPSLPHAVPLFIFFSLVFIPLVLLAVWNFFETRRARLAICEDGVFQESAFGRREILWKDVVAISWSTWGYAITVASSTTSIVISMQFAREEQRRRLTEFFRSQFSRRIQHQYRQFRASHLLWRLPRSEPWWIQRCMSFLVCASFIAGGVSMFAGCRMQSWGLILTGFGVWVLVAAVGMAWSGWEWRRVVERLGVN